ncbi:MAG: YHS domain-containing (seleno)protein [Bryobacteraceae bacterium]
MLKLITFTLLASMTLFAKDSVTPIYQENGVAVKGTDVVAYFTDGGPVKGIPQYSYEWMGATWQFANQKHLDLFKAHPQKYAPQYGGYCAYAVSKNETASITPKNWKIVNGKLYLNHLFAQRPWEKHIPENIEKGDHNWPGIAKSPAK